MTERSKVSNVKNEEESKNPVALKNPASPTVS